MTDRLTDQLRGHAQFAPAADYRTDARKAADRIEALEAVLREVIQNHCDMTQIAGNLMHPVERIAREALGDSC